MRIIVDGPDGVGKSTLIQALADYFGCDILHMTEKGSKKFIDYQDKANLDNVVSDRSFLSEMVYGVLFNKEKKLNLWEYEKLVQVYKEKGWHFIILDASTECIIERLTARGDEDPHKIKNIAGLRALYRSCAYFYELPILDSEDLNLDELITYLEVKANEQNHC